MKLHIDTGIPGLAVSRPACAAEAVLCQGSGVSTTVSAAHLPWATERAMVRLARTYRQRTTVPTANKTIFDGPAKVGVPLSTSERSP